MVKFSRNENSLVRNVCSHQMRYLYILVTLISCGVAFYIGALEGMNVVQTPCKKTESNRQKGNNVSRSSINDANIEAIVNQRVNAELSKAGNTPIKPNHPRFDKGIKNLAQGIARVKKQTFVKNFDYGTPVNIGDGNDAEGLIFYSSQSAFPSRAENAFQVQHDSSDGIALLNTTEATANCESLNVITIANSGNAPQCTAIVGNYESYHVQRWMRRKKRDGSDTGLEPVSRGQNDKGFTSFKVPENDSIEKHWKALRNYFTHLDEVVAELKLIAERVAKKNTIIVMTCNMGQSELLMNFVCNARAKSLDISNILVFPTDEGTKELAEGLGLATFYDKGVRRLIEFS